MNRAAAAFVGSRAGQRRQGRSAFTLIELVLAMGMAATLAVAMYACVRTAFKAKDSAEANVEPSRTVELAMDLLRLDFQNTVTPNPLNPTIATSTSSSSTATYLAGPFVATMGNDDRGHRADDVNFYTTADGPKHPNPNDPNVPTGDGDIRNVELTVLPYGNDHVLVRRVISNLLANGQVLPDDEVLCRGVSSFTVEYMVSSSTGSLGGTAVEWLTSWDSGSEDNTVPSAVRVTIELERPGGVPNAQGQSVLRYARIFLLPCSTAAFDTNLQGGT